MQKRMNQTASRKPDKVLVDASVLLVDPDVLLRIPSKNGLAFVAGPSLDDLEAIANGPHSDRDSALGLLQRLFFAPEVVVTALPTGEPLRGQDSLKRLAYGQAAVHLLERRMFQLRPENGAGLLELARDYCMVVLTCDPRLKAQADAAGIPVAAWTGRPPAQTAAPPRPKQIGTQPASGAQRPGSPQQVRPFAVCTKPVGTADEAMQVSHLPTTGDSIHLSNRATLRLGAQISAGGEGIIYEVPGRDQVCKVYHRDKLTKLKKQKIELMVSRRIERPGICWPTEIATNAAGEFVGYLMPRAHGQTMQSTMFIKPKLEKTFPTWTRRDLVNVAGTFLNHLEFLHRHNILIGDINPMNLLVTQDSLAVWIVDTDSFQIEAFPCPVGTANFTAPEIQGLNYASFLRTEQHELFAVATMIFMVLFPGKAPYAQQGGGSQVDNVKSGNFPYRFSTQSGQSAPDVSGEDAPQGPWQFIWSHLPLRMRQAFFETFQQGQRVSVADWQDLLGKYWYQLDKGYALDEMFPLHFWVRDPVEMACGKCSRKFTNSKTYIDKLVSQNKSVWCPQCQHRNRLERLARESHRATRETVSAPPRASAPKYVNTGWKPTPLTPPATPPRPQARPAPTTASPPRPASPPARPAPRAAPAPSSTLADIAHIISRFFR